MADDNSHLCVNRLLSDGRHRLENAGIASAALEARLLLRHATAMSELAMITGAGEPVAPCHAAKYRQLISQCENGVPPYRLIGARTFWGLEFAINEATLEPRPDTETLVQTVLDWCVLGGRGEAKLRFADIGAGTGAIGVALLSELNTAHCVATDISTSAGACAVANATRNAVKDRFEFVVGDYCDPLTGRFDFIVSNPPYIASGDVETLAPRVRDYDPLLALDGGPDGLDGYRRILADCPGLIAPGGAIFVEIGAGQAEPVRQIAVGYGWRLDNTTSDLAGHHRVLTFSC